MLDWIALLPRLSKRIIMVVSDVLLSALSFWIALLLRLEEWGMPGDKWLPFFLLVPVLTIVVFYFSGLYRMVIRHFSLRAINQIVLAAIVVAFLVWVINYTLLQVAGFPRSIIPIFGFVLISTTVSSRLTVYWLLATSLKKKIRIAIYDASKEGTQLASLLKNIESDYRPMFFIDGRQEMHHQQVEGLDIYPLQTATKQFKRYDIKEVFIANLPQESDERLALFDKLNAYPLKIRVFSSMLKLMSGQFNVEDFKLVQIEDLLERKQVPPVDNLMEKNVKNACVLVTGAGGSIGAELCRQIMRWNPNQLLLVEQSEHALFEIQRQLSATLDSSETSPIVPLLGSATDTHFINEVLQQYHVHTIYHVAAYKHVPLIEQNMITGIANNIFGTRNTAQSALDNKVDCFVLISTDKAVKPASIMGVSKRVAEIIVQSLAVQTTETRFCIVRFGNVMGSSGSVIPLFQEQINQRQAVTVTDSKAERYFMTISEAAQLIMQAGAMDTQGDIFLLDMGKPINIATIAKKMIHLSGLREKENDQGDIAIRYTGLRAGEKLHEELHEASTIYPTTHPKIMRVEESIPTWDELSAHLLQLEKLVRQRDLPAIIQLLKQVVPTYQPSSPDR